MTAESTNTVQEECAGCPVLNTCATNIVPYSAACDALRAKVGLRRLEESVESVPKTEDPSPVPAAVEAATPDPAVRPTRHDKRTWRITGWGPDNPPEVERAFRVGFRIGAERCVSCSLEQAVDFTDRLCRRRGVIYWTPGRWSDRRAAILRGANHGGYFMACARIWGVKRRSLAAWLKELRAWEAESPIRVDSIDTMPLDPPEPDGKPLRRSQVPRRLWCEILVAKGGEGA